MKTTKVQAEFAAEWLKRDLASKRGYTDFRYEHNSKVGWYIVAYANDINLLLQPYCLCGCLILTRHLNQKPKESPEEETNA